MPGDMKASLRKIRQLASRKISTILSPRIAIELSKLTPVPELLACNGPPTEDDVTLINTAIEATKMLLIALEGATQGSQPTLSSQRNQKRILVYKEFIRIHQSLLSPLRRLPVDLLSEIFIQSAYSKRGIYSTPPWALSQVCSEWRAVALDLPLLWNCIDIWLGEKNKTHASLQFLSMRLHRSREAPLDLFVGTSTGYEYIQHPIIGLLTDHAERWRSVQFQMSGRTLQAFGDIKGRLHRLRSLDLSLLYGLFPEDTITTFEVAPQLRSVSANGIPMSTRLVLPWSQLVEYSDDIENTANRDRVITLSSSLENFQLTLRRSTLLDTINAFPPTRLERLSTFSMSFLPNLPHRERPPEDLFKEVTFPSLVDLRLINYCGSVDLVLRSLIKRSHASLRILEISLTYGRLAPGSLTSILMLTPQLTNLVTTTLCPEDLENLNITDTRPPLVPILERLTIHVDRYGVDEHFEEMINNLVASRCKSNQKNTQTSTSSLLSVRLVFYGLHQCFSIHERIEKLHHGPLPFVLPSTEQALTHLTSLRLQLRKNLPRIMACVSTAKRLQESRKLWKLEYPGLEGISEVVLQSLDEIANYEKVTTTGLYASSLHHLIWHISQVIENSNLEAAHDIYDWKRKADSIIDKWNESFFIPDLGNRRWTYQGFQSIIYTPTAHEIRKEVPELFLKMIYGVQFYADKYDGDSDWFSSIPSNLQYRD